MYYHSTTSVVTNENRLISFERNVRLKYWFFLVLKVSTRKIKKGLKFSIRMFYETLNIARTYLPMRWRNQSYIVLVQKNVGWLVLIEKMSLVPPRLVLWAINVRLINCLVVHGRKRNLISLSCLNMEDKYLN